MSVTVLLGVTVGCHWSCHWV